MARHAVWLAILSITFVVLLGPIRPPYLGPLVVLATIILCLVAYAGLRAEQAEVAAPRLRVSLRLFRRSLPMWQLGEAGTTAAKAEALARDPAMPADLLYVDDSAKATHYRMGRTACVLRRAGVAGLGFSPGYYRGELSDRGDVITWYRLPVS